ncbi:MAG: FtsX-like permease family protein [Lachnospiraceae bacterium]|nr:FtsX-like permease family protein [Lachnospiraceae bacterium]
MFFHILKRDLKRKKTMNFILLLFIILATMFLASSANNLISVTGAVNHFMEISKVPDFFAVALIDGKGDIIQDFIEENEQVSEYGIETGFHLTNDQVTIEECQNEPDKAKYEKTNILLIQKIPGNFMKIFPMEGENVSLKSGEIAFPKLEADNNNLQVGDAVRIKVGEVEQEFKIAVIVKDAVFGTSYMGMKRLFITDEDFAKYEAQENLLHANIYSVNYKDKEAFRQEWQECNFKVISSIEGKDTIAMCYVMDMLVAAILIVVSVCLILIAFLVLRFTIVFTLQEDYKEIGIMKAIGIKDRGIKGLYLVKYLVISVLGAVIGLICSFPFGDMLLKMAIINIKVDKAEQNFLINVFCAVLIVGIVLLFCYSCTNSLKKFSAMDAIRSGSNGERFNAKNHLKLWKRKQMKPYLYLAVNDILSSMKRFGILAATFSLGTMLILLPLSAVNTLKDDNIVNIFSLSRSDVYIDNEKLEEYVANYDENALIEDLRSMEKELAENGISAKTGAEVGYMISCYAENPEDSYSYYILQAVGNWERHYTLLEGKEPELANEIIIADITAKDMGVDIGDSVYLTMGEEAEEFIITGTYQSMMNMGQGFRVSRKAELNKEYMAGIFCLQAEAEDLDQEEAYEKIKEVFPEYKVLNTKEFLAKMIGSVIEQMDVMIVCIVGVVLAINSLITILMMKTIMTKERGDIALLKSVGFANRSVKAWQTARIVLVLVAAIVVGTILSNLTAPYIMQPIFGMMGANKIELVMNPLEAYLIYPLLLLGVTGVSAFICAGAVKKVDLREVNSME